MPIQIIAVGKRHEDWVLDGIMRYQKRLKKPFDVEWVLLPHSSSDGLGARQDESERILTRLSVDNYCILLDEKGTELSSPALSEKIMSVLGASQRISIVIGGAYGVDQSVHERANFVWSLSPLVFPHQLVRLILSEQLYRAQEIANGGPYHHV